MKAKPVTLSAKGTVLLLIDFINDFCFAEAGALYPSALRAARQTVKLKAAAVNARVPVIYVNDNYRLWTHDFGDVIAHCCAASEEGRTISGLLTPASGDYLVLKPKNSGFFETPLLTLLRQLQARQLILAGLAADNCVLFTANDAHLREFKLVIPPDCVAAESRSAANRALAYIQRHLHATLVQSSLIRFRR